MVSESDALTKLQADLADLKSEMQREMQRLGFRSALIEQKIETISEDIRELTLRGDDYVSVTRYTPVERVVFGMVGLALVSLFGALIALVLQQ